MSTIESPQNINFDKLFFPKSIGIIGVSRDPGSGGFFLRCMKNRFKGPLYLFNPRLNGQELYGYKVHSSILEISDPIDFSCSRSFMSKINGRNWSKRSTFCNCFCVRIS